MKFNGIELSDLVAALRHRGFDYVGPGRTPQRMLFKGQLAANGQVHACDMEVHEGLDQFPFFWLTDMPPNQPALQPHLSPDGYLCYVVRDSAIVDPFDPIGIALQALHEAQRVLEAVLKGELLEDLADEFYIHWGGRWCALDLSSEQVTEVVTFELTDEANGRFVVVSDDRTRTEAKLKHLNLKFADTKVVATSVRTKARPIPSQKSWPPKTVEDLLEWQQQLDPNCAQAIEASLLRCVRLRAPSVVVFIEAPMMKYAFRVDLRLPQGRPGKPVPFKAQLMRHEISCLSVRRFDERYLAERNLPGGKTLAGLDIALVGCGTIGGYLAEMLVKAGAGTGQGGRLSLCDFGTLEPGNIGRHRLGFPSVYKFKSRELAEELRHGAPGARIEPYINDAKVENMDHVQLIIDATGEQALTDWMAWRYNGKVPLLATWVEGPGQAVRALMKATPENACPRCVSRPPRSQELQTFDAPVTTLMKGHGCEGLYVPFAATASIQAAALAVEMVQAWVNGEDAHSYRTRALDTKLKQKTFDCTPVRNQDCPACGM